jgi:hypothetical protein
MISACLVNDAASFFLADIFLDTDEHAVLIFISSSCFSFSAPHTCWIEPPNL